MKKYQVRQSMIVNHLMTIFTRQTKNDFMAKERILCERIINESALITELNPQSEEINAILKNLLFHGYISYIHEDGAHMYKISVSYHQVTNNYLSKINDLSLPYSKNLIQNEK